MVDTVNHAWQWLAECRLRLLRCIAITFGVGLGVFPFGRFLFTQFSEPLWRQLPPSSQLIAVDLFSGFWVPIEFCGIVALLLSAPWWLLEFWWMVKSSLYRAERQWLRRGLCLSLGLFWLGVSFAYLIVLPGMIHFFLATVPREVVMMPDIAIYTGFSLRLLLSFGFLFELPLLLVLVVKMGWLSKRRLQSWRRYVIVLAFVVGMIVAPDPFSQCLLALPLYGLYELGLWFAPRS